MDLDIDIGQKSAGGVDTPMGRKRIVAGGIVASTILIAVVFSFILYQWGNLLLIGKDDYQACSISSDYYPCVPCTEGVDWAGTPSSIASNIAACLDPSLFDVEYTRAYHLVLDQATIVLRHQQKVEYFDSMQHRIELRRVDDRWMVDWAGIRYQCWENHNSKDWPWTTKRCRYNQLSPAAS